MAVPPPGPASRSGAWAPHFPAFLPSLHLPPLSWRVKVGLGSTPAGLGLRSPAQAPLHCRAPTTCLPAPWGPGTVLLPPLFLPASQLSVSAAALTGAGGDQPLRVCFAVSSP